MSSNDALSINLVAPSKSGLQSVATFHPKFTYEIFGEEEKIFGYKDLKINLRYRANDMRPHVKISHSKKLKSSPLDETQPDNVAVILQEGNHLPKVAFVKEADFEDSSKHMDQNWTPPGKLHHEFAGPDGQYEIWKGRLQDPAVKQLNSRVQILVSMFIEGGSYIGQKPEEDSPDLELSDADRWTLFFLYRKDKSTDDPTKSSYIFVGYSTIYRFYWFQQVSPPPSPAGGEWELPTGDSDPTQLPCRTRLSQFVVLPPFQGKGHGARLYKTIFEHYHKGAQTQEFTVEDPNEAFDDLRDICDLAFLRSIPEFNNLRINTDVVLPKKGPIPQLIVGGEKLGDIQRKSKIASRQFGRMVEMHLMSQLPDSVRPTMDCDNDIPTPTKVEKHHEKLWQLIAKQRLYRHNRDALSQIDQSERIDKLAEVLRGVELGNARLLASYDRSMQHEKPRPSPTAKGKRKMDGEGEGEANASKKPKVENEEDDRSFTHPLCARAPSRVAESEEHYSPI